MEIEDNGRGFETNPRPNAGGGFGLMGLKERAKQLGGCLSVTSSPTKGTTVRVSNVPYHMAAAEG
jgi:signal transduction histidine kinase